MSPEEVPVIAKEPEGPGELPTQPGANTVVPEPVPKRPSKVAETREVIAADETGRKRVKYTWRKRTPNPSPAS